MNFVPKDGRGHRADAPHDAAAAPAGAAPAGAAPAGAAPASAAPASAAPASADPRAAERAADTVLLEAVRAGAPDAFDRFVERFGPMILAFGLRMCGHRQDAEDVFQETLVKVYTELRSLEDPGALRTWLWRVVSNTCLMSRRGPRHPSRAIGLPDLGPGFDPADPDAESPESAAIRGESREQIEAALARLSPEYRIIVLLRDFEGLDTAQVADVLSITEGNAKVRLHRARAALRRELSAAGPAVTPPGEAR